MDCVFLLTDQAQYWLEKSGHPHQIERDLDAWKASMDRRIALIEMRDFDFEVYEVLKIVVEHADRVLLFMPEITTDAVCREFDLPNVIFFLGARLNCPLEHAKVSDCMYFFWSTYDFYKRFPKFLQDLDGPKDKIFDVLLGRKKTHRDIIYDRVPKFKNIVTYFPEHKDTDIRTYKDTEFQWPVDVLPLPANSIEFTAHEVLVDGVIVSLSQILPRNIYRHTRYSLIAETINDNNLSFFTEKIVKPILAKRLFVVASGQYYLRNLRDLGFKTFDSVIDESYDLEPDPTIRINMMMSQVARLHTLDYESLCEQIAPILDHNFFMMTHIDWQDTMIQSIAYHLE